MKEHASAIVLGGNVNGLGVIRSLGRIGVRCGLVVNPFWGDHARYSRYVVVAKEVPEDIDDMVLCSVIEDIASVFEDERILLIPAADRFSKFLSENEARLRARFQVNCAPPELDDAFLDKWKTAEICDAHGILIPVTSCPKTETEIEELARRASYPMIIKPRCTFSGNFPGKNAIVHSANELTDFFRTHAVIGDAVVQEIIPSGDGDVIAIASYSGLHGEVLASFSWRKLRQHLPDYGATCFGVSESHPALEKTNRAFLDTIGYRGFSMSEYARSRVDSRMYFLELNTRTSWPNQMFADGGVDLTRIAYIDMTSGKIPCSFGDFIQRDQVFWLDFRRDRASMLIKIQQKEIGMLSWFLSLFKARSFAHWSARDPVPFLVACIWRVRHICRKSVQLFFSENKGRHVSE